MSSRCRFANLAVLAAIATITAACSPEDIAAAFGTPTVRATEVVPRVSGSGVSGRVVVNSATVPAHVTVDLHFAGVESNNVGAQYPVHVHTGPDCSGVGVPVTHDLGAHESSIRAGETIPSVLFGAHLPIENLTSGYYLDVHAPNAPNGRPLACAVFSS
jgi:hypothetical protein